MKTYITRNGYRIVRILGGRSNVFLLTHGGVNILIDTTVPRLGNKLQKRLSKAGFTHIDYLVLTHAHFDHAGNARMILEKFGTSVLIQKNEAEYLVRGDNIIPRGTTFITRPLINTFGRFAFSFLKYQSCPYDVLVDSYFDLKELGFNAYILHTPGHTRGSQSLIIDDEIAIVGDAMIGVFKGSVFPPFAENTSEMIRSWGKLLKTNCSLFLPSHGSANSRSLLEKDYQKRIKKV